MKRSSLISAAAVAAAALLPACGDRVQMLESGVKIDMQAFQGTGMPYSVPGWKQGDKASWEQQVKVRTQSGQNDYVKIN
jgi:hypothetical protein